MIEGSGQETFTAEEFARIVPPACPVCGATVSVNRIDVTLNAEEEALRGRTYMMGRWNCPHGCDPRTGTRRHYGQSCKTDAGRDVTECTCTCGDVTLVQNMAEFAAWHDEHHR